MIPLHSAHCKWLEGESMLAQINLQNNTIVSRLPTPKEKYYFFNKKVTSFSYPVVKSRIPTLLYFLKLKKPESNVRFHETLANIIVFVKMLG